MPQTFALSDGFYWSGRESLPFAPGEGNGFNAKSFGLTTINTAYRLFPYMAAAGHSSDEKIFIYRHGELHREVTRGLQQRPDFVCGSAANVRAAAWLARCSSASSRLHRPRALAAPSTSRSTFANKCWESRTSNSKARSSA